MARQDPPYTITSTVIERIEQIGEAIGRAETTAVSQDLRLRRINRIRTIQGSLAIEGNVLSEDQIATILDGRHVVAPLRDVQEARNAIAAYEQFTEWAPANESDLLRAHEPEKQSSRHIWLDLEAPMTVWSLQDAKNRFSAVVEAALAGRPQRVTRRGKPAVVVIADTEYERLSRLEKVAAPTFAELLLAIPQDDGEFERLSLAPRGIEATSLEASPT